MKKKLKLRNRQKRAIKKSLQRDRRRKVNGKNRNLSGIIFRKVNKEVYSFENDVIIPECNYIGECCCGNYINLEPSDVYRIMNSSEAIEKFGLKKTMDLYDGENSLLAYSIGKDANSIFCVIKTMKANAGLHMACPFLAIRTKYEGAKEITRHICILGEDKPTACKMNPVVQFVKKNKDNKMAVRYLLAKRFCKECVYNKGDKKIKIEELAVQRNMEDRFRQSITWIGFLEWLRTQKAGEDIWKFATLLAFDYDRIPSQMEKIPEQELLKFRPASPDELIVSVAKIIERTLEKKDDPDNGEPQA